MPVAMMASTAASAVIEAMKTDARIIFKPRSWWREALHFRLAQQSGLSPWFMLTSNSVRTAVANYARPGMCTHVSQHRYLLLWVA